MPGSCSTRPLQPLRRPTFAGNPTTLSLLPLDIYLYGHFHTIWKSLHCHRHWPHVAATWAHVRTWHPRWPRALWLWNHNSILRHIIVDVRHHRISLCVPAIAWPLIRQASSGIPFTHLSVSLNLLPFFPQFSGKGFHPLRHYNLLELMALDDFRRILTISLLHPFDRGSSLYFAPPLFPFHLGSTHSLANFIFLHYFGVPAQNVNNLESEPITTLIYQTALCDQDTLVQK